jgi:hypothetical protein
LEKKLKKNDVDGHLISELLNKFYYERIFTFLEIIINCVIIVWNKVTIYHVLLLLERKYIN